MIEYTDIQTTFIVFLSICGGAVLVSNAVKAIMPLFSPFKKFKESAADVHDKLDQRVSACEEKLRTHEKYFENDKEFMADLEELCKVNVRVNLAMLNHFIDGNGVEKMKELREEIQDKLLEVD